MAFNDHCPDCGALLIHEEGCLLCYACGWSECNGGIEGFKPLPSFSNQQVYKGKNCY